jgi:hypothetical protein
MRKSMKGKTSIRHGYATPASYILLSFSRRYHECVAESRGIVEMGVIRLASELHINRLTELMGTAGSRVWHMGPDE